MSQTVCAVGPVDVVNNALISYSTESKGVRVGKFTDDKAVVRRGFQHCVHDAPVESNSSHNQIINNKAYTENI